MTSSFFIKFWSYEQYVVPDHDPGDVGFALCYHIKKEKEKKKKRKEKEEKRKHYSVREQKENFIEGKVIR